VQIDPTALPSLRIGDAVPTFSARSTQGPIDLNDFRGRWLILFSHPGDFTPVCTSEFIALARALPQFEALDCALIGVSVDSLYSHLAWLRAIYDMSGVKVEFPLVEDPTLEIARAYAMVGADAQDASTVRTTCFIDPDGILRASTAYPASVGRSIPEMLRMLDALQHTHEGRALAPANWSAGDPLLLPPHESIETVLGAESGPDWFYTPETKGR